MTEIGQNGWERVNGFLKEKYRYVNTAEEMKACKIQRRLT